MMIHPNRKRPVPAHAAGAMLAVLIALPALAFAQSAPRKLGRGLAGMTAAFLEVPGNMIAETRRHGPGEGVPLGFAKGLGMIVPRTLVGVYEFTSAPFPMPEGYRPMLDPEFPWSYFDEGPPRVAGGRPHPGGAVARRSAGP